MTISVARNEVLLVEILPAQGTHVELDAGEEARVAIAARLGVRAVRRLTGAFDVVKSIDGVDLKARIRAVVVRECVASLEEFDETIDEPFEIHFARGMAPGHAEVEVSEETPEPLDGDSLDLGEILIQQLALAMDPYPRKPGVGALAEAYAPEDKVRPFAGLRAAIDKARDRG